MLFLADHPRPPITFKKHMPNEQETLVEDHIKKVIRNGLLEFAILNLISISSKEPSYSLYAKEILEKLGATEFKTTSGTLYQLLRKLRTNGFIECHLEESDVGPVRKNYHLTEKGGVLILSIQKFWRRINRELNDFADIKVAQEKREAASIIKLPNPVTPIVMTTP
jgi:PadR family transcriptional regulator PadR